MGRLGEILVNYEELLMVITFRAAKGAQGGGCG